MSIKDNTSQLLRTPEVALRLGLTIGTLQNLRCRGEGPAYIRLGRAIRYRPEDIDAFISANRTNK
jgi:predicted DNA-binding transcriptional regulator AlpA